MAFIDWSDKLSIGILKVDSQHKRLIGLINQLHGAMKEGRSKEVLDEVLAELVRYTKTHFVDEEAYMWNSDYPEFPRHKTCHDEFIARIGESQKGFAGGKMISIDLLNYLNRWFIDHICGEDRQFGDFFRDKRKKRP